MFLLSYRNTSGSNWENEKCCGNTSCRWVFPQLFWVLLNFHKCFYNSIETWRTCFLFLLENTVTKKRETTCLLWSSKCKFSLLAPSLRQQLVLVLCFYQVIETRFLTSQGTYFLKAVLKNILLYLHLQADVLLDRNCSSLTVNNKGETALDLACRYGHVHVCSMVTLFYSYMNWNRVFCWLINSRAKFHDIL